MPIQVIVVLFIALVVGGAILAFTKQSVDRAQVDLNEWRKDPAHKDQIVEVSLITEDSLKTLANTCVQQELGNVDEKICFVVFADQFTVNWPAQNGIGLTNNFRLDTRGMHGSPAAVRITYHPYGNVSVN